MTDTMNTESLSNWMSLGTPTMIGTPDQDAQWWSGPESGISNDCDVQSQQYILQQFTHTPIDEQTLANEAEQNGWFDPQSGTNVADLGALLTLNGIPNEEGTGDINAIENQLSVGHKVIAFVDAGTLDNGTPDGTADHAVVVDGVDMSDPNNPQVIISDPYTGGAEDRHPLDQFLQAWQEGDNIMVNTDVSPTDGTTTDPSTLPTTQDPSTYTWDHTSTPTTSPQDLYSFFGSPDSTNDHTILDPSQDSHCLF